jgi:hypothetical protein
MKADAVVESEVRAFHPQVISEIGLETALAFLEVANDLRSGVIPPENFNMVYFDCGTAHCIGGWVAYRMKRNARDMFYGRHGHAAASWNGNDFVYPPLWYLFHVCNPSDPKLAADAIERYLYTYAANPWAELN